MSNTCLKVGNLSYGHRAIAIFQSILPYDIMGRTASQCVVAHFSHVYDWPSTMATGSSFGRWKANKTGLWGMHCIAPGCTNHFYKKQEKVHNHRLPVANKELLRKWLQKIKLLTPQWTAIHVFVATTSCQRIMSWLSILMNWVNTGNRGQIGWCQKQC